MGSPLADPEQRRQFLEAATAMGFAEEGFIFSVSSSAEGLSIVHRIGISRLGHSQRYVQSADERWIDAAKEDLTAGKFGAPIEFREHYTADRDGVSYDYTAKAWPWRDGFTWEAKVYREGQLRGQPTGQVNAAPPTMERVQQLVKDSIESRSGVA